MTKNQQDAITADRRLNILKCLKAGNFRMSDALLKTALHNVGCASSTAVILADLAWLKQLGLLSTTELGGMTIAILNNDGLDVADGVTEVPGIAKPRPE